MGAPSRRTAQIAPVHLDDGARFGDALEGARPELLGELARVQVGGEEHRAHVVVAMVHDLVEQPLPVGCLGEAGHPIVALGVAYVVEEQAIAPPGVVQGIVGAATIAAPVTALDLVHEVVELQPEAGKAMVQVAAQDRGQGAGLAGAEIAVDEDAQLASHTPRVEQALDGGQDSLLPRVVAGDLAQCLQGQVGEVGWDPSGRKLLVELRLAHLAGGDLCGCPPFHADGTVTELALGQRVMLRSLPAQQADIATLGAMGLTAAIRRVNCRCRLGRRR